MASGRLMRLFSINEINAVVMVMPALGPSLVLRLRAHAGE